MNTVRLSLIFAALATGLTDAVASDEQSRDYPGILEIGTTLTALADSSGPDGAERGMDFDVYTAFPTRNGSWSLLVEATTHSMSEQLPYRGRPASGRDPWGPSRDGEARVAEFHYAFQALGGDWWIGLLDSKAHIDGSVVANDDKEQFMGAAFVKNPSIAIPENSLGFAYRRDQGAKAPGYTVLATEHETDATGMGLRANGLFLAAEMFREMGGTIARLGVWTDTSSAYAVTGHDPAGEHHGIYASLDGQFADLGWNVRAGTARLGSSAKKSFVGVAAQIPWRRNVLAFGVGHSAHSRSTPTGPAGQSTYLEIYYRFTALGRFVITPDIQYRQIRGPAGSQQSITACIRLRTVI